MFKGFEDREPRTAESITVWSDARTYTVDGYSLEIHKVSWGCGAPDGVAFPYRETYAAQLRRDQEWRLDQNLPLRSSNFDIRNALRAAADGLEAEQPDDAAAWVRQWTDRVYATNAPLVPENTGKHPKSVATSDSEPQ